MNNALLRGVMNEALNRAGRILRESFGKASVAYKGRADIVTSADMDSQAAILKIIRRRLPEHDYLAEEKESRLTGAEFLWIIDPLDGTTNYAHGYPASCVSIGLLRKGRPFMAGVHDPFREERFTAEAGRGARLNGRPIRVSKARRLSESLLITGFPYDRAARSGYYVEFYRSFLVECHDIRRSGSAALDMAWIAAGRADGFWEFSLAPWDVAAGWLLVSEAGGKVSDFAGLPWRYPSNMGRQTLATNGLIHDEMLKPLRTKTSGGKS